MAVLNLTKAFINNLNTGEGVGAQAGRDRQLGIDRSGEVRTYGGGRRRSVTQAGTRQQIGLTLRFVSATDAATLEEWIGEAVLYRDDRGRRIGGIYFALDYKEYVAEKDRYDIGITLTDITWREGL